MNSTESKALAGGGRALHPGHFNQNSAALMSLIGSGVVWGLSWWPLQFFARSGLTGHSIGLTAYSLVALIALPLIWRERRYWKSEWKLLCLIGLFFGCAHMSFTAALTMGSVIRAMLLFYLLPAWGAIGGAIFLKERIRPRRLLAVVMSLAGVFVIMGNTDVFKEPLSFADLMALVAGFCYTGASIANRKARSIPMVSRTLASFVGCMVVAVSALLVSTPEIPEIHYDVWILLVLFSLFWLLGGTVLTTYGVRHVEASRAAVLQVVELLVAVASAIVIGGESMALKDIIGGAMIVAATLIEATSQDVNQDAD